MSDHRFVRADTSCPLCQGPKAVGLVACWRCYGIYELRYGNPWAEEAIDSRDDYLASVHSDYRCDGCAQ